MSIINDNSYTGFPNINLKHGILRFGQDHAALTSSLDEAIYTRSGVLYFWDGSSENDLTASASAVSHSLLSATHADSTAAAVARGSIITGQGSTAKWVKLTIGTTGYTLLSDGTDLAWGQVANAGISATAAIDYSKLAACASNKIIAGVSNVPTVCAVAGDVTMTASGTDATFAIASGVIINTDIKSDAAIAWSKTAGLASAHILVGNGSAVAVDVAVSGDVTLANDGGMTVTDLTIASEAQGDVLIRGASGWQRLAAGTSGKFLKTQGAAANPIWDSPTVGNADALVSPFTIEGGTYDPETTITAQTSSAAALTIPDLAGVAQEWVFSAVGQTLTNKTLTSATLTTPKIVTTGSITDAGGDEYIVFIEDTTPIEHLQLTSGDAGVGVQLKAATSATNADLHLDAAGSGDIFIDNGSELTFARATFNALVVVADQTGEAHTFNIPDIATGASDTFVFLAEAQTLTNKTLTSPTLTTPKIVTTGYISDAGGNEYLQFVESGTPVNHVVITQGDTTVLPMITAGGEENIGLMLHGKGTGNVVITDGGDITAQLIFELDGATTSTATTLTVSQTVARTITLPDATDTLVGKATVDTFTNKTFDCDGTGNALSNVNATELDPVGDAAFGIPFVISKTVAALAAAGTNIISANPKMRILDAWFVATSADSGTIAVHAGQVGTVGANIVETITIAADDNALTRATGIDNAAWEVAENGGLVAVGDGGASIDGTIFVLAMRID